MEHYSYRFDTYDKMKEFIDRHVNLLFCTATRDIDINTGDGGRYTLKFATQELFPIEKSKE